MLIGISRSMAAACEARSTSSGSCCLQLPCGSELKRALGTASPDESMIVDGSVGITRPAGRVAWNPLVNTGGGSSSEHAHVSPNAPTISRLATIVVCVLAMLFTPVGIAQATCGDSTITGGETCDDANSAGGDGCSSSCQVEAGYYCNNSSLPSSCCLDGDGDTICDASDNCPSTANVTQADGDGDLLGDACDNCAATGTMGWTALTNAGSRYWSALASSADGTKVAAAVLGGYIYTSTDSGGTWTQRTGAGSRGWISIASSSDGTKLVAATYNNSYIYTSSDSGSNWTERTSAGDDRWASVASSADGTKLVAVSTADGTGSIVTSTDSGVTWSAVQNMTGDWRGVASSADGVKLVVVDNAQGDGGRIYRSTDSGVTWSALTGSGERRWSSIASSADGVTLAAATDISDLYLSTNSGSTWSYQGGDVHGEVVSVSGDGRSIASVGGCFNLARSREFLDPANNK